MSSAAASRLRDQVTAPRGIRAPTRERPRLTAVPPAPAPSLGDAGRPRLAMWGVDAIGLVTGTMIGLFWYPAAALLAMLAAALISWSERR